MISVFPFTFDLNVNGITIVNVGPRPLSHDWAGLRLHLAGRKGGDLDIRAGFCRQPLALDADTTLFQQLTNDNSIFARSSENGVYTSTPRLLLSYDSVTFSFVDDMTFELWPHENLWLAMRLNGSSVADACGGFVCPIFRKK